jgi:hypothetical protein
MIRVYIWFNCFNSDQIAWTAGNHIAGWGRTQHYSPFTSHRESTALAQTYPSLPRPCAQSRLPAMAGQPSPIICAASAWLSGCSPGSSPPLPLHGNHSHREASPPLTQMKGGHKCQQSQQPALPPYLISFLKKQ